MLGNGHGSHHHLDQSSSSIDHQLPFNDLISLDGTDEDGGGRFPDYLGGDSLPVDSSFHIFSSTPAAATLPSSTSPPPPSPLRTPTSMPPSLPAQSPGRISLSSVQHNGFPSDDPFAADRSLEDFLANVENENLE